MMAELRRCHTPTEASLRPALYLARERIGRDTAGDVDRLALALALVAHVKEDDPQTPVAVALAGRPAPTMHPLRFQRLLQADSADELHAHGVRLIRLLKGRVNIRDLLGSFDRWDNETRREWAQRYYENVATNKD